MPSGSASRKVARATPAASAGARSTRRHPSRKAPEIGVRRRGRRPARQAEERIRQQHLLHPRQPAHRPLRRTPPRRAAPRSTSCSCSSRRAAERDRDRLRPWRSARCRDDRKRVPAVAPVPRFSRPSMPSVNVMRVVVGNTPSPKRRTTTDVIEAARSRGVDDDARRRRSRTTRSCGGRRQRTRSGPAR